MAITMMCGKDEPGAVESKYHAGVFLRTFAVGTVVDEYENNFYDDSDFYAVYFENGVFKKIQYGTTRGWTYPNNAHIDAPAELREKYRQYLAEEAARNRAINEQLAIEPLLESGLTEVEARKIADAYGWNKETMNALGRLMKTARKGKFRSEFRAKLAAQVDVWLGDEAPKFATPLSMRQLAYV